MYEVLYLWVPWIKYPIGSLQSENMLNMFPQDGFFGFYFWTGKVIGITWNKQEV